jgi:hypothetical protein
VLLLQQGRHHCRRGRHSGDRPRLLPPRAHVLFVRLVPQVLLRRNEIQVLPRRARQAGSWVLEILLLRVACVVVAWRAPVCWMVLSARCSGSCCRRRRRPGLLVILLQQGLHCLGCRLHTCHDPCLGHVSPAPLAGHRVQAISGVIPLFKFARVRCSLACVRAHTTCLPCVLCFTACSPWSSDSDTSQRSTGSIRPSSPRIWTSAAAFLPVSLSSPPCKQAVWGTKSLALRTLEFLWTRCGVSSSFRRRAPLDSILVSPSSSFWTRCVLPSFYPRAPLDSALCSIVELGCTI